MKKVYKISSILLILSILCTLIPNSKVFAQDNEYKCFFQEDPRWGSFEINDSGETIADIGCAITSLAVVIGYANPAFRDVNKFNPQTIPETDGMVNRESGGLSFANCGNVDPTLTMVSCDKGAFSNEEIAAKVKQGLFVIVGNGSHYSTIVGVDGDYPILHDVSIYHAQERWTIDDFRYNKGRKGSTIYWLICFQSSVTPNSLTVLTGEQGYDGVDACTTLSAVDSAAEQRECDSVLAKEWDLEGMPEESKMNEGRGSVSLPDGSELSTKDKMKIGSLDESIDLQKAYNKTHWLYVTNAVIGLLVAIYGFLFLAFYTFDKINVFFEVRLLKTLTLGRCDVWEEGVGEKNKKASNGVYYLTRMGMLIAVCSCIMLGLLLSNGFIYRVMIKLVYKLFTWFTSLNIF